MPFDDIGPWSEIKLEIIRKYAAAYSAILTRRRGLHHVYIAGASGPSIRKVSTETAIQGGFATGIDDLPMNLVRARRVRIGLDSQRVVLGHGPVLRGFLTASRNPYSVLFSLGTARENARAIREALGFEIFVTLNQTYRALEP